MHQCVGYTTESGSGIFKSRLPILFIFRPFDIGHKTLDLFLPVQCRSDVVSYSLRSHHHQLNTWKQFYSRKIFMLILIMHLTPPPCWYPNNSLETSAFPLLYLYFLHTGFSCIVFPRMVIYNVLWMWDPTMRIFP